MFVFRVHSWFQGLHRNNPTNYSTKVVMISSNLEVSEYLYQVVYTPNTDSSMIYRICDIPDNVWTDSFRVSVSLFYTMNFNHFYGIYIIHIRLHPRVYDSDFQAKSARSFILCIVFKVCCKVPIKLKSWYSLSKIFRSFQQPEVFSVRLSINIIPLWYTLLSALIS